MTGFGAHTDFSPNRLEKLKKQLGPETYIDLTSTNPTHQGLLFPASLLEKSMQQYTQNRTYDPDPRGQRAARDAIRRWYAERLPALPLSHEHIFLTASTSEAYSLLFSLLAEPGDEILVPDITYPLFDFFASHHRLHLRHYHLSPRHGFWEIDEESIRANVTPRTRALLLISPHHPTGQVISRSIAAIQETKLPVLCDEVFASFPYGKSSVPPASLFFPDQPVFLLNGISKLLALPDMKLGWTALNDLALNQYGERLELLNDTFLGASGWIQHALPSLLTESVNFQKTMQTRVQNNISTALSQTHPRFHLTGPEGGYILFPRVDAPDDEALACHLLQRGVFAHPGYYYGETKKCRLMLSALTAPERFHQGLSRLLEALP